MPRATVHRGKWEQDTWSTKMSLERSPSPDLWRLSLKFDHSPWGGGLRHLKDF